MKIIVEIKPIANSIKKILFDIKSKKDVKPGSSVPDLVNWSTTVGRTKFNKPTITNIENEKEL